MRSSLKSWSFVLIALGAAGCIPSLEPGNEGAPMEPAEITESQASPSCSLCMQACRVHLRSCRRVVHEGGDGSYLLCEIDRGGCANLCRTVCR